ncbi:hypothetical protein LSH36_1015g00002 [Paralvinella palmiformis]|uniref:GH10 domain-containing protein n=1 Tax=Paralvinella palmiformis TaxID=53620 RepID=A0AAD9IVW8_9ANNE|nr:hypothetical protein LSH36_1015g00002 [Paralvinella palmiformis]
MCFCLFVALVKLDPSLYKRKKLSRAAKFSEKHLTRVMWKELLTIILTLYCVEKNVDVYCTRTSGGSRGHSFFYRASTDLLESGSTYLFNIFIKLTSSVHDLVQIATLSRSWYRDTNRSKNAVYKFYRRRYDKVEDRWLFLSIDYRMSKQDFILDAASLTKVYYPNWKSEAINNIAKYRMGGITINLNVSSELDPSKVTAQSDQKFEIPDAAYSWLESKNINVRGHNIHWNVQIRTPDWVEKQENKTAEVDRRTDYVVNHYKGKFKHWDVINEYTNSRLYQNWLGREDVPEYIYSRDTVNVILRLKEKRLIDGIGLQGHFGPVGDKLDMELIKKRLEIFTGLGIPVWITELTVRHPDSTVRGNLLSDLLTLFYGTPGVHGILMWDCVPRVGQNRSETALTSSNLTVRFRKLVHPSLVPPVSVYLNLLLYV